MGPRWKGKNLAATATSNPMSEIVAQLKSSLARSEAQAMLSGCSALLEVTDELHNLLDRSCFGREISTSDKDKHWFQLGLEEAFYIHHTLQSLAITKEDGSPLTELKLWEYMSSQRPDFPEFYKAYAHLRDKNWVVRPGVQFGVDFVAYRHHPALVHSEYAVILLLEGDDDNVTSSRLKVWPDLMCSLRVCGSVAKTLLILNINKNGSDASLPSSLEQFTVEERTITRWVPEQCREEGSEKDGS